MLAAWVESMACSICSNCSKRYSIIWQSSSAREMPKLVFQGLLSAGGGAEYLCSRGAISVLVLKGSLVGVTELQGDGREHRGTVTDLEGGGRESKETVLKPKFCKEH
jgi:hypothetical protein